MDRKLATVRKIAAVDPIEGADAIEVVTVDGWKVVSKKGEFQPGDLCVYFEIDSVLPVREEFEFLRKGCFVKKDWLVSNDNETGEGFRLKTIRLRGQVSQGLVVPFSPDVQNYVVDQIRNDDYTVDEGVTADGTCVTDYLGVVKWDPPVPATLAGRVRGNFPSFIPKTDQERIQNISARTKEAFLDDEFEATIKLDGSSMTVYHNNGKLGVCSRNLDLDWENDPENTFAKVFVESGLKHRLEEWGENVAIQGELMGPGVQGNQEELKGHSFFIYDVWSIDRQEYYSAEDRQMLVADLRALGAGIQHCPVLRTQKIFQHTTAEILEMADGPSLNVKKLREGIVFKSIQNPHFSFKAISNRWLLKHGD